MAFISDFKAFIMRGNVVDLAVGVIIGAAFGGIVTSLVNDIIMPPIGQLTGGHDFSNYFIALDGKNYPTLEDARKVKAAVIAYGSFANTLINFLIVAFAIFLLVKAVSKLYPKPVPPPPPGPTPSEKLLAEIRDLLAAQKP